MAVQVHMPQWGMAMKEGRIVRWLKKAGESVIKGEPLLEVETEKITNEVEAVADGVLFQIIAPEGNTELVGAVVGIIAAEGETPEMVDVPGVVASTQPEAVVESPASTHDETAPEGTFIVATPAARRLAKESGVELNLVHGSGGEGRVTETDVKKYQQDSRQPLATSVAKKVAAQSGVDLSTVTGSGSRGKITKGDVLSQAASSAVEPARVESIPYSGIRKSIGDSMLSSLATAAQLSASVEVDVTEMVNFREMMRDEYKHDESVKISFNDIILMAVSRALTQHPIMNSTHIGDEILLHDSVNLGIAVALSEGLIVPVLKNVQQKGLLQISAEARELAAGARAGSIGVEEISGGTFSVSNTGTIAVDAFTPILRPPETGILGVARIKRKPAEFNGEIALRWMTVLTLTYNHCVVDGVPAHLFLETVSKFLQKPYLMMS